jgi:two-component system NtrC family sensor kinase
MTKRAGSTRREHSAAVTSEAEGDSAWDRLQLAEDNYRVIFENSAVAITVSDENENLVSWNKYAEVLLRRDEGDLRGRTVGSLYPVKEWKRIRAQNVRRKGIQNHIETKMIRGDGETIDVDLSLNVFTGLDGTVAGSIGIITDITGRKRAQEQLKLAEESYRTIFENSAVAITVADRSEKIVSWNKYAESLLRMDRDDLHMRPVRSLFPDEEWQRIRSQNIRQKGLQHHLETRMIRGDLETIDVDLSLTMLKGQHGDVAGSIGIITDITERRKILDQLRTLEETYRTLFENSAVAVTIADDNEQIVSWNKFAEILLGATRDDLYMKPVSSLYPDDQWQKLRSQNIRQKGMQYHLETRVLRKSQEPIDVDLSVSVLRGPDGEVTGSIGIIVDITELKRAKEVMRQSEERFRLLVENSMDAVAILDADGTVKYESPSVERVLGYKPEELLGENILAYIHPDDQEAVVQAFSDIIAQGRGQPLSVETRLLHKDGEWRMIEGIGNNLLEDPRLNGIVINYRDTTERKRMEESLHKAQLELEARVSERTRELETLNSKLARDVAERERAEQALRESEKRFREIFNGVSDEIIYVDPAGTVLQVNDRVWDIFGYAPSEIIGRNIGEFDLFDPTEEVHVADLMATAIAEGRANSLVQVEANHKDGHKVAVEVDSRVIRSEDGDIEGFVNILRDVTERKRAEEEKQTMEQQLQLAGRLASVGELASGVAHELNNPIAVVLMYAELLRDRQDLEESAKADVQTIMAEAERASRITGNLLSFARKHKPERALISINEVIEKTLELHVYRMKVNNIEVSAQLDPDLPLTMADYYQLQQVFVNVITNAEQVMTEAHGRGTLSVTSATAGMNIVVTFADDGPGIPEENLNRIFDPFFTTKEVGKGTGLGLSICFGIVQGHGGRMYATSDHGKGTTFVVEIPIVSEAEASNEEADSAKKVG